MKLYEHTAPLAPIFIQYGRPQLPLLKEALGDKSGELWRQPKPKFYCETRKENIMFDRLIRVAALATVASCVTAFFGPTAFGQPTGALELPVPTNLVQYGFTPTWHGSASCTVTATSPGTPSYFGVETHRWEIIPWRIYTNANNSMQYYLENWSATGHGHDASRNWTVNAQSQTGPGYLQFYGIPLKILRGSSQQTDDHGATGTRGIDVEVWELGFPGPALGIQPIEVGSDPNLIKDVVMLSTTGHPLSNEPSDGENTWMCQWDFEYARLLQPWPERPRPRP